MGQKIEDEILQYAGHAQEHLDKANEIIKTLFLKFCEEVDLELQVRDKGGFMYPQMAIRVTHKVTVFDGKN